MSDGRSTATALGTVTVFGVVISQWGVALAAVVVVVGAAAGIRLAWRRRKAVNGR